MTDYQNVGFSGLDSVLMMFLYWIAFGERFTNNLCGGASDRHGFYTSEASNLSLFDLPSWREIGEQEIKNMEEWLGSEDTNSMAFKTAFSYMHTFGQA